MMQFTVCGTHTTTYRRGCYQVSAQTAEQAEELAQQIYGDDLLISGTFYGVVTPVETDEVLATEAPRDTYADTVQPTKSETRPRVEPFFAAKMARG